MTTVQIVSIHVDQARDDIAAAVIEHTFDIAAGECICGHRGQPWALAQHVADKALEAVTG